MTRKLLWNAHSHFEHEQAVFVLDALRNETVPQNFFCVGIHPWDALSWQQLSTEQQKDLWLNIEKLSAHPLCVAIGETGLDGALKYQASEKQQLNLFLLHAQLAKKLDKPLVIHCVKRSASLLAFLKQHQLTKIILHDTQLTPEEICQLQRYPKLYFSFKRYLFSEHPRHLQALQQCPSDRLLVESDDDNSLTFSDILNKLAEKKAEQSHEQWRATIYHNTHMAFFG